MFFFFFSNAANSPEMEAHTSNSSGCCPGDPIAAPLGAAAPAQSPGTWPRWGWCHLDLSRPKPAGQEVQATLCLKGFGPINMGHLVDKAGQDALGTWNNLWRTKKWDKAWRCWAQHWGAKALAAVFVGSNSVCHLWLLMSYVTTLCLSLHNLKRKLLGGLKKFIGLQRTIRRSFFRSIYLERRRGMNCGTECKCFETSMLGKCLLPAAQGLCYGENWIYVALYGPSKKIKWNLLKLISLLISKMIRYEIFSNQYLSHTPTVRNAMQSSFLDANNS